MKNTLYYGDNLEVLRKYVRDETVDLSYIDPPFNSKRNYNQIYNNVGGEDRAQAQAFVDTWEWDEQANIGYAEILANANGRFAAQTVDLLKGLKPVLGQGSLLAYLVSMTLRVTEIHRVLKPTGSFYLHCDPTASHYLKIVLDSIFVTRGGDFKNEIIWKRTTSHNSAKRYGPLHDVILYYTKSSANFVWNQQYGGYDETYTDTKYRHIDPETGLNYRLSDMTGPGVRQGASGEAWRGYNPTLIGRHWQPPSYCYMKYTEVTGEDLAQYPLIERLDKLDEIGLVQWPKKKGGRPEHKRYLNDMQGMPMSDVWVDIFPINSQAAERLGYPTQKPEALLERIIAASTNEGDAVLDAYCGCGTTVAVAERLKRRWIGIDITYQSIALILRRLEAQYGKGVLDDITLNGVPRDMQAASALALKKDDRVRKEFEKWAVLTYSHNRAAINDKKGGDGGIDGVAYFLTGRDDNAKIVFQVKSGNVGRGDIAKLNSDRLREEAELAVFLTLKEPTGGMTQEANGMGLYTHPLMGKNYARVLIVTVADMLEHGARLDIPLPVEVLKTARAVTEKTAHPELFDAGEV